MAEDTIRTEEYSTKYDTVSTSYETIFGFTHRPCGGFSNLKLWARIQRTSGSGTVYLRLQLTDGTTTYNSTDADQDNAALTSATGNLDGVGPATITLSGVEDKEWTINVQAKVDSGSEMRTRGIAIKRTA